MTKTPYYLHRLAKSQGKTPEELVKAALEEAGNPHAAAKLLDVSHDTINSFMAIRGWQLHQCTRVIEPESEAS